MPVARRSRSMRVRTFTYACMTGAGCATLTYTKCRAPAVFAAIMHSWADTQSTDSNSAAFAGEGCGVPTRCTTTDLRGTEAANVDRSSTSPRTRLHPSGALRSEPGRTSARTSNPRVTSRGIKRRPMYPVPPVTKTLPRDIARLESVPDYAPRTGFGCVLWGSAYGPRGAGEGCRVAD